MSGSHNQILYFLIIPFTTIYTLCTACTVIIIKTDARACEGKQTKLFMDTHVPIPIASSVATNITILNNAKHTKATIKRRCRLTIGNRYLERTLYLCMVKHGKLR